MRRRPIGVTVRRLLHRVPVAIRWTSRHPNDLAVRRFLRGVPVVGGSGMGVLSTNRKSVSFSSLDFHASPEGRLAPVEGLAPPVRPDS